MGKMLVAVLSLVGWVAISQHAMAQHFAVMGLGANSCSVFAEDSRVDPSGATFNFFNWAQGFMSGLNLQLIYRDGKNAITKDLNAVSIETQERYLRNYCDQHPLGDVEKGILELYFSLPNSPPMPH